MDSFCVSFITACRLCHLPCVAAELQDSLGTITGQLRLPYSSKVNTTKITLNNGEYLTYSQMSNGSFVFHSVRPGIHLLDVQDQIHMFSQVKIQLLPGAMDAPKCIEYVYPGAPKRLIDYPLTLTAHAKYDYFEPVSGFSILSILKNPMMLMMIVSAGLMFIMPKMMENLEPEERERMKKQMEMQSDPTKMLSSMWADLTGGNSDSAGANEGGGGNTEATKKISKGGKSTRRTKKE